MKPLAVATLFIAVCLTPVARGQTVSSEVSPLSAPADAFLSWTVSPGVFLNGVWSIPGTTTLTALVADEFGEPITQGNLYWQTCTNLHTLQGLPSVDCAQKLGPAKWQSQVWLNPGGTPPTSISPCFCAGQQVGFRLLYRAKGSGFKNVTGEAFDLFATSSCPDRSDCP
jgi:hypothetical protein